MITEITVILTLTLARRADTKTDGPTLGVMRTGAVEVVEVVEALGGLR